MFTLRLNVLFVSIQIDWSGSRWIKLRKNRTLSLFFMVQIYGSVHTITNGACVMQWTVLFVVYNMSLGKELDNLTYIYIMNRYTIICTEVHYFILNNISFVTTKKRDGVCSKQYKSSSSLINESGNFYVSL